MNGLVLFVILMVGCASRNTAPKSAPEIQVAVIQSIPEETSLAHPDLAFAKDAWIKRIDQAQQTIEIEQMYLDGQSGQALDGVIAALDRAAKRGVKIRFILSRHMFDTDLVTRETLKRIPSLELRSIDIKALTGGIQHAKFWIFDHQSIFVGSQNFDWKSLTQIHETGVMIDDGTLAAQLKAIFDLDWQLALTGKLPQDLGTAPVANPDADVKLVASPPVLNPKNIPSSLDELTDLLNHAQATVRITLLDISTFLYGHPGEWHVLDDTLRATAQRGVKIQLLVSHWNTAKPEIATIKALSRVPNIEVRIATVPEHSAGAISFARVNHSKFMTIDDSIFWVGTSNWAKGYFWDTRGIEIVMKRPALAAIGNQMFDRLWNASFTQPVDINRDYPKPRK